MLFRQLPDINIEGPELRVGIIGDTGKGSDLSFAVCRSFSRYAQDKPLNACFHTGDIIYDYGASSLDAEEWESCVKLPFSGAGPIHFVRGNHDDDNREYYQEPSENLEVYIQYAEKNPDFIFPSAFYSRVFRSQKTSLHAFFLDTPTLMRNPRLRSDIEAALKESSADWKMLLGHHPLVSYGMHGPAYALRDAIESTVKNHVDVYACGHEHDLQILVKTPVLYLVSGAGAECRRTSSGPETVCAESSLGFMDLLIEEDQLFVSVIHASTHKCLHQHVHERPKY